MNFIWQSLMLASLFSWFSVNWEAIDDRIEREYPRVSFISRSDLQQTLNAGSTDQPLLIDVRTDKEYAVSRLPGARHVQSAAAIASQVPDRSTPVVVYCSVGYRSAGVAAELLEMGYTRVYNLRHSLFGWANAGLPLEDDSGPTPVAHPFNRVWGSLLDPERRRYTPATP